MTSAARLLGSRQHAQPKQMTGDRANPPFPILLYVSGLRAVSAPLTAFDPYLQTTFVARS
eukprot:scaffold237812_cov25-Tisochrysis_lutea.AAC.2